MTTSLYTLTNDLIETLNDNRDEICGDVYPSDMLHEYVDRAVPVYYHELAQCLADNTSLGEVYDSGLLPENPDVWQIIQTALYEELSNAAHEWLEDAQEEYDAEQEEADDDDDEE
jgi:hypothetical protein